MLSTDLNLNATLGCTFIGILFEILYAVSASCLNHSPHFNYCIRLYGFSCAQTQYYYYEYWSDRLQLRALVHHHIIRII